MVPDPNRQTVATPLAILPQQQCETARNHATTLTLFPETALSSLALPKLRPISRPTLPEVLKVTAAALGVMDAVAIGGSLCRKVS